MAASANVDSALSSFGVDALGHQVYRALLRGGPSDIDRLARRVGSQPAPVRERLDRLAELGLVTLAADGTVQARSPRLALGHLADSQADRLRDAERELNALRQAIPGFLADEAEQSGERLRGDLELIGTDQLVPVIEHLVRDTTGELRLVHTSELLHDPMPVRPERALAAARQAGRTIRSLYPANVLEDDALTATLRTYATEGELIRLHPEPPSRLGIFGTEAALVPIQWGAAAPAHRVVVRNRGLVAALATLFDQLWTRATPLPDTPAHWGRAELLALLAAGAKDEAIARNLGLSLRTVRRRVAALLEELDAPTRFVAGVEAAKRGWV